MGEGSFRRLDIQEIYTKQEIRTFKGLVGETEANKGLKISRFVVTVWIWASHPRPPAPMLTSIERKLYLQLGEYLNNAGMPYTQGHRYPWIMLH